jgi:hypothetical protein
MMTRRRRVGSAAGAQAMVSYLLAGTLKPDQAGYTHRSVMTAQQTVCRRSSERNSVPKTAIGVGCAGRGFPPRSASSPALSVPKTAENGTLRAAINAAVARVAPCPTILGERYLVTSL